MFRHTLLLALSALIAINPAAFAHKPPTSSCAPLGKTKAQLQQLKMAGWLIDDTGERDKFVLALASCNGDPDPEIRDGIAFEATQHFLRGRLISEPTMLALSAELQKQLTEPDIDGFRRPFAVLNLSEIARTDRVKPWLTETQRAQLVRAGVDYMRGISDYRGFDPKSGYRHSVAHSADLLMQLALNPAVDKNSLVSIRDAIATQVSPTSTAYVTGESERLARPILFMAQRGVFSEQEWLDWFTQFSSPGPLDTWDGAFQSEAGLKRRHNLTAFLSAIYVTAQDGGTEALAPVGKAAIEALKKLP